MAIVGAALLLRLAASAGDLWLDELVSLQFASRLTAISDVLLRFRHDNNHPLNTLMLWAIQPTEHELLYRLPAVLAGTLCVVLAGMLGPSRPARLALLVLTASSYLLVHYSSEARGYALSALASVSCLVILRRTSSSRWVLPAVLFNLACLIGLLSHFSFIHFYAACLAWCLWKARQRRDASETGKLLGFHALPTAAAAGIAFAALDLHVAGGSSRPVGAVLRAGASLALGLPEQGSLAWLGAGIFIAAILFSLARMARQGEDRWILYGLGIALPPAVLLATRRGEFAAVRYLLPSVLLSLLLIGESLGQLHARGKTGRLAYSAILLLFLAANARLLVPLLRYGRGEYARTLRMISGPEQQGAIAVGLGDESMRLALEHYAAREPRSFRFVEQSSGPEWVIDRSRSAGDSRDHPRDAKWAGNAAYEVVESFRGAPRRGGRWVLFRRVAGPH